MFITSLEERAVKKQCIEWLKSLSTQKKQWLWFVILWLFGISSLTAISMIIKLIMGI